eukprot:4628622-Karenia_brevis.AAC.1
MSDYQEPVIRTCLLDHDSVTLPCEFHVNFSSRHVGRNVVHFSDSRQIHNVSPVQMTLYETQDHNPFLHVDRIMHVVTHRHDNRDRNKSQKTKADDDFAVCCIAGLPSFFAEPRSCGLSRTILPFLTYGRR